jgi:peroxiredoxin
MKIKLLATLAALSLWFSNQCGTAAEADNSSELKDLITKIQAKLKDGKKTEKEFSDELKQFDTLVAKHQGEKTDEVAQILYMEAMLYWEVLDNSEKSLELVKQIKRDLPDTSVAKNADQIVESMKKQEEAKKIQRTLVDGAKFPDFSEKDVAGKPLSVANYRGKVVLIDFWATWCGPCVAELPNVLKTYETHHGKGFEIIGISLDQDEKKLTTFTQQKNMPWQQYFDGQGWTNKLASRYGVSSIPATYLLDGDGKILAKNLRGEALEQAVAKALAKP